MTKKRKPRGDRRTALTAHGSVELSETQLDSVTGGTGRRGGQPEDAEQTENVSLTFAKVTYTYTPQR